jgi:putative addiction module component (TIGR02574 family)
MNEFGTGRLNVEERLALAEEIWGSVARDPAAQPFTAARRQELDRRLAGGIARLDAATPWEQA